MISESSHFRVLFPSEPTLIPGDEVVSMLEGYKHIAGKTKWSVECGEFGETRIDDERLLREAYRGSAEAVAKNRGQLLKQSDVILNGILGTEFIIEGRDTVTYMRAFLAGRRMYTLTVVSEKVTNADSTIPLDVQQFFESFTFWG